MVQLTEFEAGLAAGEGTPAQKIAIGVVVKIAEVMGAERLLEASSAHIDSCLYHGLAGLEFAEMLASGGGEVAIPSTLNVSSLDLLHPELYRGDAETAAQARRLMDAYEAMGCRPTWTCAPYQLAERPGLGDQIVWAESNAIVFANSALGARTNRYGDFIDICSAITGRVPAAGLHLDEPRLATTEIRFDGVADDVLDSELLYAVLGHISGEVLDNEVAVISGLPPGVSEDRIKALGAAAASSGAVALIHLAGSTPEAPDTHTALGGRTPQRVIDVSMPQLDEARSVLSTQVSGPLAAVNMGTPHASLSELEELAEAFRGETVKCEVYVSTGRDVLAAATARGWEDDLTNSGVKIVTDTCTYITPIVEAKAGVLMTNSAKWAFYAPTNLGMDVAFGSTRDCIDSALAGEIVLSGDWGE
ncbi:MAG: aconitase X catalytic domain-containing protein [Acidimicrobiia bacterium]|nr:aconitase X catalytic domain-containing protein [Acidimicrobiia bacterium]